jgi:hypothetical protein
MTTPLLRGYPLKDKKWMEFHLDGVSDIVWDSRLRLSGCAPRASTPETVDLGPRKRSVQANRCFGNVAKSNGCGMIMQLSGPPGVGKTLSAESVAETMKVPLLVLSAGDLGTTVREVEWGLKDILRMVAK